jgi:hypothetical protein
VGTEQLDVQGGVPVQEALQLALPVVLEHGNSITAC